MRLNHFSRNRALVSGALLGWMMLAPGGSAVDFASDVQPVLAQHCIKCHGGVRRKSGISFLSRESALDRGKSGRAAIVPGDVTKSELLRRVTSSDPDERMPPEGAPLDDGEVALLRDWILEGAVWTEHWSFQPVRKPSLPDVKEEGAVGNPVDRFIVSALERAGGTPSGEADRHVLIRRLYLDLLGLPPPIGEVEAFVADTEGEAYGALVERLLSSPHFGERWGRHWLDQARYADSDGYEKDNPRPDAWRWRDWVIEAFNRDLPFDQFTLQQLAGDLLPGGSEEETLATAFHLQTLFNREGGVDPEEDRTKRVIDRVNTTATVWLGLTVGCSQCHNHPYDPLSQPEFYGFYAFFNNADEGQVEVGVGPGQPLSVRVLAERRKDRRATHLFQRGDFLQPDQGLGQIRPHTQSVLHPFVAQGDEPTRVDLARWLVDAKNPLTARVRVNKIWSHLFGRGLVATMDDFGSRGALPSHPDLLDWLAGRFIGNGWSTKALIRLIVMSGTYRQSSVHRPEMTSIDPDNLLWHRQNRFRVEAEIVRDLHLAVSGLLSPRVGGPSVYPPIPEDVAALSYANNFKWKTSEGEDRYRRGMYSFFKRTAPDPNLMIFDCPDANVTRTERSRSNTPIQALATLQNEVYVEAARAMGRRVLAAGRSTDEERLSYAFQISVARAPGAAESRELMALLRKSRRYYQGHEDAAKRLAGEEGALAVELASWVATARIIMNLDEFVTRE